MFWRNFYNNIRNSWNYDKIFLIFLIYRELISNNLMKISVTSLEVVPHNFFAISQKILNENLFYNMQQVIF